MQRRFSLIALCVVAWTVASCATGKEPSPSFTPPTAIAPSSSSAGAATTAPLGQPVLTPVIGSVLAPPTPVAATDGKLHLAYELVLTNTLPQQVTLTSLAALAGDKTLLSLSGDGLAYWTRPLGQPTPSTKLGPAQTALVWLDVAVEKASTVPSDITHTIGLTVTQPQPPLVPVTITETIAPTKVNATKPVIISPPLSGASWLNSDGCCGMSAHRMAVNPLNGQLWAAERYAIDFVQLTSDGRLFIGDKTKPESYPYFGADIRAVADGPVVAVVNNLPEQVPGTNPTGLPLDQYSGNHIVQDIGGGNFALYAHLKLGSVRVKVGDKLTTGQTIASLGNTGNTSAPH
ncbi:MAG TPA: M23 family metallopeptidase, partial [Mycobacterium sp.]|nr:M23 family metallopeptidase [Mycobacterium sp.]